MPTFTEYLTFNTKERHEFINITEQVEEAVRKSKIKDGLVLINPMHITAAVYVNDAEAGLIGDFEAMLRNLVPPERTTSTTRRARTTPTRTCGAP